jgi:multidrug transporter EmrE-like cation transporter
MSYANIVPLALMEVIGDIGYKEFANKGGVRNFAMGSAGYVGVIYFLIRSLQGSQILVVNTAWDGISAIIESMAAFFILGERFDDPFKYIGVLFIIVGLFFLKIPLVGENKFTMPKLFT